MLAAALLLTATATACRGTSRPLAPPSSTAPTVTTTTIARSTTSARPHAPTTTGKVARGPRNVADLSWIGETHGWALAVRAGCVDAAACPSLYSTTNAGSSWTQLGDDDSLANVQGIRFASASVGYAFDPDFMTSTDGGKTWVEHPGVHVGALEANGRDAIRLAYEKTGCPGPCGWTIDRAATGTDNWATLRSPKPVSQAVRAQLVRQGGEDVYVAYFGNPAGGAGPATTDLLVSHDDGATWARKGDPCNAETPDEIDTVAIAAAPRGVVVALCQTRVADQPTASVVVSADGAETFGPRRVVAEGEFRDAIAATSASDIVVGGAGTTGSGPFTYALDVSHDAGRNWSAAVRDPQVLGPDVFTNRSFLGFTSAKVGRWVGYPKTVWTTTDGGDHWKARRFT